MEAKVNETGTDEKLATAVFCRKADTDQIAACLARLGRSVAVAAAGGVTEARDWVSRHPAPGLMIVDIAGSQFPVPALADLAAAAGPACRIVAVGNTDDVALYRSLLQTGIFDYLVSPVTAAVVSDLLARSDADQWLGMPEAGSVRVGQTMAVTGASGGVGVSTLVTLLAGVFADTLRMQTLLVDFDRRKGDLALLLGLKADNGLAGILAANEIDYRLIARTVLSCPARKKGDKARLSLLAQKPGVETPVDPALLLDLGAALCELFSVSVWDIPSHRPEGSNELLVNADVCVIVFDLTVSGIRSVKNLLAELGPAQSGQRRFLVVNHCRFGGKGVAPVVSREEAENFLGTKIDFELPYAGTALEKTVLEGRLNADKADAYRTALESLAAALLGRPQEQKSSGTNALAALKTLAARLTGKER